eukprot:g2171.t1
MSKPLLLEGKLPEIDEAKLRAKKKFLKCCKSSQSSIERELLEKYGSREELLLSAFLIKINRKGKRQKRVLAVTNLALYNFVPAKYTFKQMKRRIALRQVTKIFKTVRRAKSGMFQFAIKVKDEYDYRYEYENAAAIIDTIQRAHDALVEDALVVVNLEMEYHIEQSITTKPKSTGAPQQGSYWGRRGSVVKLDAAMQDASLSGKVKSAGASLSASSVRTLKLTAAKSSIDRSRSYSFNDAPVGEASVKLFLRKGAVSTRNLNEEGGGGGGKAAESLEVVSICLGIAGALEILGGTARASKAMENMGGLSETYNKAMSTFFDVNPAAANASAIAKGGGDSAKARSPKQASKAVNVIVSDNTCGPHIATIIKGELGVVELLLDCVAAGIGHSDGVVSHWATKSLWLLMKLYRDKNLLHKNDTSITAFARVLMVSFAKARPFTATAYDALLQILLDRCSVARAGRSGEHLAGLGGKPLEAFGKTIHFPRLLETICSFLRSSDLALQKNAMKDLNYLLCSKVNENFDAFLRQPNWHAWFLPLLSQIPARKEDRSDVHDEVFKLIMNLYAMLHHYCFRHPRAFSIEQLLHQCMFSLQEYARAWTVDCVRISRTILMGLLSKIEDPRSSKSWKHDLNSEMWENMYKVLSVIKEFIFYKKVDRDMETDDPNLFQDIGDSPPSILKVCKNGALGSSTAGAPFSAATKRSRTLGLHLDSQTFKCLDKVLVEKVTRLMRSLGFAGKDHAHSSLVVADSLSTRAKTKARMGSELCTDFENIRQIMHKIDTEGEAKIVDNMNQVSKLVEASEKKNVLTGFLKRNTSLRKTISLRENVYRLQAQKMIATQSSPDMRSQKVNRIKVQRVDSKQTSKGNRIGAAKLRSVEKGGSVRGRGTSKGKDGGKQPNDGGKEGVEGREKED